MTKTHKEESHRIEKRLRIKLLPLKEVSAYVGINTLNEESRRIEKVANPVVRRYLEDFHNRTYRFILHLT